MANGFWETGLVSALVGTGLLILLALALGFAVIQHWRQSEQARAHLALLKRIDVIESQLLQIGQAVLPISTSFQTVLIKELTHFHTPRCDALLAKLGPPYTLTPEEEAELVATLRQREVEMGDQLSETEREAAHIFPVVMKRAKAEAMALSQAPSQFRLAAMTNPGPGDLATAQLIQRVLERPPPPAPPSGEEGTA